jgi:uncharacterized membrane protein YfcA
MFPYVWKVIDWKFVFQILIGIIIGSPIGLYLLKYLSPHITHLSICLIIILLIAVLPVGVFIGNKFFIKSKKDSYRKIVLYFLITISIIGIFKAISFI